MMQSRTRMPDDMRGFTLIEMLVVVAMVGVLAVVIGPSYSGFINNQRLQAANEDVFLALRDAQTRSRRERRRYQVSLRTTTQGGKEISQWAVHRPDADPVDNFLPASVNWQSFDSNVQIVSDKTTFADDDTDTVWRVIFNERGEYDSSILGATTGKVVLSAQFTNQRQCTYVSTLLGHLRQETGADKCGGT